MRMLRASQTRRIDQSTHEHGDMFDDKEETRLSKKLALKLQESGFQLDMEIQPRSHHQYRFPNFFGTYFAPAAQAGDWGLKSRETNVSRSPGSNKCVFHCLNSGSPVLDSPQLKSFTISPWPPWILPFWSPEYSKHPWIGSFCPYILDSGN